MALKVSDIRKQKTLIPMRQETKTPALQLGFQTMAQGREPVTPQKTPLAGEMELSLGVRLWPEFTEQIIRKERAP